MQKVQLKQWFLRITAFKEALLKDLDNLSKNHQWSERVISMQRHWIGRSSGARIRFPLATNDHTNLGNTNVDVFTTRPDTLFGVQYLALSTQHPITTELAKKSSKLQSFIATASNLPPDSKDAFLLSDIHAVNPLSLADGMPGTLQAPLPVYVAPYVLGAYGKGAMMGVPGHDLRDCAFWQQNHTGAQVRSVIRPVQAGQETSALNSAEGETFTNKGVLTSFCGLLVGHTSEDASKYIVDILRRRGDYAEFDHSWRLRDWLISRQRYWGTPIPIIHCDSCGAVPVPKEQLPVELPSLSGDQLRGTRGNPLESAHEWLETSCPQYVGR